MEIFHRRHGEIPEIQRHRKQQAADEKKKGQGVAVAEETRITFTEFVKRDLTFFSLSRQVLQRALRFVSVRVERGQSIHPAPRQHRRDAMPHRRRLRNRSRRRASTKRCRCDTFAPPSARSLRCSCTRESFALHGEDCAQAS